MAITVNDMSGGGAGVWFDITDSLTWLTGKVIKRINGSGTVSDWPFAWTEPDTSGQTSDTLIAECRHAEIPGAAAGDRYRVTGWCMSNMTHGLYAFLDGSGNLLDVGYGWRDNYPKTGCENYAYETLEFAVPKKADAVVILNWNKQIDASFSLDDIIVEKLL